MSEKNEIKNDDDYFKLYDEQFEKDEYIKINVVKSLNYINFSNYNNSHS